jgi:hypothetical protein
MRLRFLTLGVWLLVCVAASPGQQPRSRTLDQTVRDYVGLYTRATLPEWKKLFHPMFTAAHAADDGSIRVRNLEEFYRSQQGYFATGHSISERLENVRIEQGRRIARVNADFVLTENGEESRGKLGLHLVEGTDGWRIVAVVFSYDKP